MSLKVGPLDVIHCQVNQPEKDPNYRGLRPGQTVFQKGYRQDPGRAAFLIDTIWDRDVEVPLRDGVKLRADVFRPATSKSNNQKVPALIAWSPYGKTGQGFLNVGLFPGRVGVPRSRTSGFESFEAPDPAEWTARGYAICNIDARGAFDSEGDIRWWGSAEGRDGYDAIEHLASQSWCNGSIGLVGNSWLAISQYFIAAEHPPHLKCIAPLEGASDTFRENLSRGGIPQPGFGKAVAHGMYGRSQQEDIATMLLKHSTWDEYWDDKRAKFDKIEVPTYILASYSSGLHTEGSFRAYEEISAPKWIRVHPHQEWYDLYLPETNNELQEFFDRYLKGIKNDWEGTPKVRVSILRYNDAPIINHVFTSYPVPSTNYRTMFLDVTGRLSNQQPQKAGSLFYQADAVYQQVDNDEEELRFEYTFDGPAYLVGYSTATLYMSTAEHDDMDVYIQIRKADKSGKTLQHLNIPSRDLGMPENEIPPSNVLKYLGPAGMVRASHREVDINLSQPHKIVLSHRNIQKLKPDEIVKLEIPIWPGGIAFETGEKLVLKISGHEMRLTDFDFLRGKGETGKGKNIIYCGERGYFSKIKLPFVEL